MIEFDWSIVRDLVIIVVAVLLGVYVRPWLRAKLGEAGYQALWERICVLVQAAQQLFPKGEDGVKTGEKKKDWVCDQLEEVYGIKVTEKENAMIEAAVHELT